MLGFSSVLRQENVWRLVGSKKFCITAKRYAVKEKKWTGMWLIFDEHCPVNGTGTLLWFLPVLNFLKCS